MGGYEHLLPANLTGIVLGRVRVAYRRTDRGGTALDCGRSRRIPGGSTAVDPDVTV